MRAAARSDRVTLARDVRWVSSDSLLLLVAVSNDTVLSHPHKRPPTVTTGREGSSYLTWLLEVTGLCRPTMTTGGILDHCN
jgi:hypothetical protein